MNSVLKLTPHFASAYTFTDHFHRPLSPSPPSPKTPSLHRDIRSNNVYTMLLHKVARQPLKQSLTTALRHTARPLTTQSTSTFTTRSTTATPFLQQQPQQHQARYRSGLNTTSHTTTPTRRHFTSENTPKPPKPEPIKPPQSEQPPQQAPKASSTSTTPAAPEPKPATTTTTATTPNTTPNTKPVTQTDVLKAEIQTNETKATYLDRRDNIHSYEAGQFQVATGKKLEEKNTSWLYYLISIGFASLGMSFVAVPLYQAFCQMTGSGGQIRRDQQIDELNRYMQRTHAMGDVTLRPIEVTFQATVDVNLDWSFYPCQKDITLRIGETALAFFRARNNGSKPIIGVSTYNVLPPQAGLYFNKIQCFCFDEQRLRAGEEIDMPVFFFLDPAMADDWRMDNVDQVTLCYTFFEVQEDEVEAAVKGLNEVRELNNQRITAAGYGSTPSAAGTTPPETKTITHTFTINVEVPTTAASTTKSDGGDEDGSICPIIPPTAMHNPSGISLMQSQLPRIVSDDQALANQAKVM